LDPEEAVNDLIFKTESDYKRSLAAAGGGGAVGGLLVAVGKEAALKAVLPVYDFVQSKRKRARSETSYFFPEEFLSREVVKQTANIFKHPGIKAAEIGYNAATEGLVPALVQGVRENWFEIVTTFPTQIRQALLTARNNPRMTLAAISSLLLNLPIFQNYMQNLVQGAQGLLQQYYDLRGKSRGYSLMDG
jgi:hypothetical protein